MNRFLNLLVIVISLATIASGLVQVVVPSFVLDFIGAEVTPSTKHFFGIIGMFMALFGGLMIHAVYSAETSRVAVFWAALQKLGAAVAVSLGIISGIFSILAGLVVGFDLVSGILFLVYWRALQQRSL